MKSPGEKAAEIARMIPGALLIADGDGQVSRISEAAARLLGIVPEAARTADGLQLERLLPGLALPSEAGTTVVCDLDCARPDGTGVTIRARIRREGSGRDAVQVALLEDTSAGVSFRQEADAAWRIVAAAERAAGIATWEWDAQSDRVTWSDRFYRLFGHEPGAFEPSVERFLGFIHPDDRKRTAAQMQRALAGTAPARYSVRAVRADGSGFRMGIEGQMIRDISGGVRKVHGTISDETGKHEADRSIARLEALMACSFDGIVLKDADGRIEAINPAAERICGYRQEEVVGRMPEELLPGPEAAQNRQVQERLAAGESDGMVFEATRTRPDGDRRELSVSVVACRDDRNALTGTVAAIRDRAETPATPATDERPEDDRLTGLTSSVCFMESLPSALKPNGGALLRFDLDNMKLINDLHGYSVGDRVMRGVGRVIRNGCGRGWFAARLGGDEFAVFIPDADPGTAEGAADRFLTLIRGYVEPAGAVPVTVTSSIGIARCETPDGLLAGELVALAGRGLDRAKQRGRDTWVTAEQSDQRPEPVGDVAWGERIRRALAEGRLALHLQPVADLASGKTVMHEVLLRIVEDGRYAAPGPWLEMAERLGMIHEIDRTVMRKALDLLESNPDLRLSVNISGKSLGDSQLLTMIEQAIGLHRVDPAGLVIELTETAAVVDQDRAHRFAEKLGALGCGFAIDDFGTGFGSYDYLKNVPADYLKIDGGFIQEWTPVDQAVVASLVGLAKGLGKKTVAEGVESGESLRRLAGAGVDLAQGFHIARPAPAEAVLAG